MSGLLVDTIKGLERNKLLAKVPGREEQCSLLFFISGSAHDWPAREEGPGRYSGVIGESNGVRLFCRCDMNTYDVGFVIASGTDGHQETEKVERAIIEVAKPPKEGPSLDRKDNCYGIPVGVALYIYKYDYHASFQKEWS